jgi:NAD(P)H dehydrogenase (quinone)
MGSSGSVQEFFQPNKLASGSNDANWAGGFTGAFAISPSDSSPEQAPFAGDLQTAHLLGRRIT